MNPNVIVGSQKTTTNLNMRGTKGNSSKICFNGWLDLRLDLVCGGLGVRHVVYWHLQTGELAATNQPLKVNLIVYDNDVMQVTGTSFYLWVPENFQTTASQVATLISEVRGNITQSQSPSRCIKVRPSQHKFPDGEGLLGQEEGERPEVGCCLSESAKTGVSFARIVRKLQSLNREMNTLTAALADLTEAQQRHNEQTAMNNKENQERMNFMNDRILEIRELTGPRGLSAAHLARIKKIKRGSIFEDKTANHPEGSGKGGIFFIEYRLTLMFKIQS